MIRQRIEHIHFSVGNANNYYTYRQKHPEPSYLLHGWNRTRDLHRMQIFAHWATEIINFLLTLEVIFQDKISNHFQTIFQKPTIFLRHCIYGQLYASLKILYDE